MRPATADAGFDAMGEIVDLEHLRRRRDRISPVVYELRRAGLSAKTIEHYQLYMERAEAWCREHGTTLLEAPPEELAGFVSAQGAARGSQRVIRCALAWYWRTHGRSDPPLDAIVLEPPAPPALRSALSDDEVAKLGAALLHRGDRPAAAASVALLLGLSGAQIAQLRWADLRSDGSIEVRDAAGRAAVMAVHPALAEALRKLKQTSPWVFPSHSSAGHVRAETVYGWLRHAAIDAGLDGVRADALRRSPITTAQSQVFVRGAAEVASTDKRRRPVPSTPGYLERMEAYRATLRRAGLSPTTVRNYTGIIARAERWCADHGCRLVDISEDQLQAYVALQRRSHATLNGLRKALLHYWRLHQRPDAPLWIVRVPRKPLMVCRALDEHEAARVVAQATATGGPMGAAVLLGLHQALRVGEIARVRWDDFGEDGWMRVMGKGDLPASLPVHPAVRAAVDGLTESSEWLFPGRKRGGPICPATAWDWIRQVGEQADVANVTPHRLRHTALSTANDRTGDLRAVMTFARHARPETTAGYTRTTASRLTAVMEAISYGQD